MMAELVCCLALQPLVWRDHRFAAGDRLLLPASTALVWQRRHAVRVLDPIDDDDGESSF